MDVFFVREKLFFYIVGTTVFKDKNNFRTILFNLMLYELIPVYNESGGLPHYFKGKEDIWNQLIIF
jgi:hypothetical protein